MPSRETKPEPRKQAKVKPMSAHDEKMINNAIALANEFAMQCNKNDMEGEPTSPKSDSGPESPKLMQKLKMSIKRSPKQDRKKTFSEEIAIKADLNEDLPPESQEAYNILVMRGSVSDKEPKSPPPPPRDTDQLEVSVTSPVKPELTTFSSNAATTLTKKDSEIKPMSKSRAAMSKIEPPPIPKPRPEHRVEPTPRVDSISKMEISKPEISKPEISKPEISKPEISRPEISKPEISRPEISRPELPPKPDLVPRMEHLKEAPPLPDNPPRTDHLTRLEHKNDDIGKPEPTQRTDSLIKSDVLAKPDIMGKSELKLDSFKSESTTSKLDHLPKSELPSRIPHPSKIPPHSFRKESPPRIEHLTRSEAISRPEIQNRTEPVARMDVPPPPPPTAIPKADPVVERAHSVDRENGHYSLGSDSYSFSKESSPASSSERSAEEKDLDSEAKDRFGGTYERRSDSHSERTRDIMSPKMSFDEEFAEPSPREIMSKLARESRIRRSMDHQRAMSTESMDHSHFRNLREPQGIPTKVVPTANGEDEEVDTNPLRMLRGGAIPIRGGRGGQGMKPPSLPLPKLQFTTTAPPVAIIVTTTTISTTSVTTTITTTSLPTTTPTPTTTVLKTTQSSHATVALSRACRSESFDVPPLPSQTDLFCTPAVPPRTYSSNNDSMLGHENVSKTLSLSPNSSSFLPPKLPPRKPTRPDHLLNARPRMRKYPLLHHSDSSYSRSSSSAYSLSHPVSFTTAKPQSVVNDCLHDLPLLPPAPPPPIDFDAEDNDDDDDNVFIACQNDCPIPSTPPPPPPPNPPTLPPRDSVRTSSISTEHSGSSTFPRRKYRLQVVQCNLEQLGFYNHQDPFWCKTGNVSRQKYSANQSSEDLSPMSANYKTSDSVSYEDLLELALDR